jgi:hypothetical protein
VLGTAPCGSGTWPTRSCPRPPEIVDYFQAREHVHDLVKRLAPVLGDNHHTWLAARLADLDQGDIENLVKTTALPINDTDRDQIDAAPPQPPRDQPTKITTGYLQI